MTDVPIHDVDREILARMAIPALCHEGEIPLPIETGAAKAGDWAPSWDPAKAKHTTSALAARLRAGHFLSIMIILFAAMPPESKPRLPA